MAFRQHLAVILNLQGEDIKALQSRVRARYSSNTMLIRLDLRLRHLEAGASSERLFPLQEQRLVRPKALGN